MEEEIHLEFSLNGIISFAKENWKQLVLFSMVFVIIYVVDYISYINALMYSIPSAVPSAMPAIQMTQIPVIKKKTHRPKSKQR